MTAPASFVVPEGYTLHKENTSAILLPASNDAFLNPVQEFNRDLSVACIRTWGETMNAEKERKWRQSLERRAKKAEGQHKAKKAKNVADASSSVTEQPAESAAPAEGPSEHAAAPSQTQPEFRPQPFVILEALSATGLRSIRYANEIPLVKHVIANDLSPAAVEAMRRNIELNDLHEKTEASAEGSEKPSIRPAKVRVNEGDACALMYNHRMERNRVDVVDLDPYGTAAPFIDAAVQCVNDGGLLCVTCTDMSVLATTNYPEKCFSNYGGAPVKAEYCHEAALRLVLHTLATSAARYGRYIYPLLSLSIDFYVRLFVRVHTSPIDVKRVFSKTAVYYVCSGCQFYYEQPLGRVVENTTEKNGKVNVNVHFKVQTGPGVSERCPECNSAMHVAGPMWSGALHDKDFVSGVLSHVESNEDKYGTAARMKGMLTVAKEELDTPFYFTPSKVSSHFHCVCPSLDETASAILHAGHKISRSHACAGSLKTTASYADIHDIFRSWVKTHPVRMDKVPENSPTRVLLSKEAKIEANFKRHPESITPSSKVKLVRYQQNPTPNWGPGAKPSGKRKRDEDE
ncbi:N2,N2-dimethylguanosine tRNA methyltransferase [Lentinus tigrinus ALCF2SS1-6]|uniref:tRNA (guanine(26)-N(2))-dimethyltransferase n=1 Tax=Lentinus tigrinus ALCF2SS1-6 TaxID=1328759 RepID=A0A5C2SQX1_9APHY|nr:N2,N2-dimethylguanosine tRNA methyltransferase [Lentinus tigrinus ALCF2SS1-6]